MPRDRGVAIAVVLTDVRLKNTDLDKVTMAPPDQADRIVVSGTNTARTVLKEEIQHY